MQTNTLIFKGQAVIIPSKVSVSFRAGSQTHPLAGKPFGQEHAPKRKTWRQSNSANLLEVKRAGLWILGCFPFRYEQLCRSMETTGKSGISQQTVFAVLDFFVLWLLKIPSGGFYPSMSEHFSNIY